jgi:hypothetical protein
MGRYVAIPRCPRGYGRQPDRIESVRRLWKDMWKGGVCSTVRISQERIVVIREPVIDPRVQFIISLAPVSIPLVVIVQCAGKGGWLHIDQPERDWVNLAHRNLVVRVRSPRRNAGSWIRNRAEGVEDRILAGEIACPLRKGRNCC